MNEDVIKLLLQVVKNKGACAGGQHIPEFDRARSCPINHKLFCQVFPKEKLPPGVLYTFDIHICLEQCKSKYAYQEAISALVKGGYRVELMEVLI